MVSGEDFKIRRDLVKYAFSSLSHRLLRSGLTVLSIMIGIMAIFALVSFGQGLSKYTNDIFEEMGTNKIMVQPREFGPPGSGSVSFTEDDIDFVSKVSGVDVAVGMPFAYVDVKLDENSKSSVQQGFGSPVGGKEEEVFREMLTVDIEEGRYLKKGDRQKVVLGYNYMLPNKIFEDPLTVGDKIIVHGIEMKIVGFLEKLGNPSDDGTVMLTNDYFGEVFDKKDKFNFIYIATKEGVDVSNVADKVEERLRDHLGQEEGKENFFVQTFQDLMQTSGAVIGVINGVVVLIALISVFVAAVNITNTMYTAVLERTQEIGIMKAIGARNSDILKIFLIESAIIGFVGGVFGITLGAIIAKVGGLIAASAGYTFLKPYFPLWLIAFSLLFAIGIGMGAGALPAIQASKQKPVEALRYE